MNAKLLLVAALCLTVQGGPKRPLPPDGAPPLAPVQEPARTPVERRDLLQRFGQDSPLAGFYRLRSYSRPGAPAVPATGYLAIGQRHLSIHLQGRAANGAPALQSAFRSYRVTGQRLQLTSLAGFRTDADGVVRVEPAGLSRLHTFRLVGSVLTLHLDGNRELEFERIE